MKGWFLQIDIFAESCPRRSQVFSLTNHFLFRPLFLWICFHPCFVDLVARGTNIKRPSSANSTVPTKVKPPVSITNKGKSKTVQKKRKTVRKRRPPGLATSPQTRTFVIFDGHTDIPLLVCFPIVLQTYFFQPPFRKQSCKRVATQISFKKNHWFFNCVPLYWAGW